ncbi:uncharacterized protein LOC135488988 isoform X2 [Lineus longissimus]|uniref:uncharacterized protein LOC135488988 isoform X2 n=1 Tax=Lineus longissimus TaxID=88925 RepID=UPI00315D050C
MEATNSLLSSLVQTKAIERVLAPIAAQVSQLILLTDSHEKGDASFPSHMVPFAENVLRASESLIEHAQRNADISNDQELHNQMPSACDLLLLAGNNFVVTTRRLELEPRSKEAWRHLVRTAKDVLEGTMKVLLVSDDADVRRIVSAARLLEERTGLVIGVKSMKALVLAFKGFTEALMLLSSLVETRQQELTNPRQRERLLIGMTLLRKSGPMLCSSMQTCVKYQQNPQALASKDYVINQILSAIDDVIKAVENRIVENQDDLDDNTDEPGHFVSRLDEILVHLSPEQRSNMDNFELDTLMEAVVRHSMSVAHMSAEIHRNIIIQCCKTILRRRSSVSEYLKSMKKYPDYAEIRGYPLFKKNFSRSDFDEACEKLIDEFHDLERHVNSSILQQIVDIFAETTEPLERLVKAALCPTGERTPLKDKTCQILLEPYIETFNTHSERITQVALFAAASSTDGRRVRIIKTCVKQIEKLDPEILPATLACRKDCLDKGALGHLRLLKREWTSDVESLVSTLDEMMDARIFLEVSERRVKDAGDDCRVAMISEELDDLNLGSKALIGRARRAAEIATKVVDNHEEPVYRNGLLVFINQLRKGITAVKSGVARVMENITDKDLHHSLIKRSELLLKCVKNIRHGMDEENQPDLLSSLRDGVRPPQGLQALGLSTTKEGDSTAHLLRSLNLDVSTAETTTDENDNMFLSLPSGTPRSRTSDVSAATSARNVTLSPSKLDMSKFDATDSSPKKANSNILDNCPLARSLVNTALGLNTLKTDLLSNDLIARTSHIIEVANAISVHCDQTTKTDQIHDLSSSVTQLTPQVIDKAKKVSNCDVDQIEPLNKVAEEWSLKVCQLENAVDEVLDRWKIVCNRLVTASKCKNVKLLTTETKNIQDHTKYLQNLVTMATDCMDTYDFVSTERAQLLKDYGNELDNLTMTMTTMADIISNSEAADEKTQLENASREWASKVYCLCMVMDRLSAVAKQEVLADCLEVDATSPDYSHLYEELKLFEHEMIRYSDMVHCASQGNSRLSTKVDQCGTLMNEMDKLSASMSETVMILQVAPAQYPTPDRLFAPQKLGLVQCQWVAKTIHLCNLLEELTKDLCIPIDKLARVALAVHTTSDAVHENLKQEFTVLLDKLTGKIFDVKGIALQAIEDSTNLEQKGFIRQCLGDVTELTGKLVLALKNLSENPDNKNTVDLNKTKLRWACRLHIFKVSLMGLDKVDRIASADVVDLLKQLGSEIRSSSVDGALNPTTVLRDVPKITFSRKHSLMDKIENAVVGKKELVKKLEEVIITPVECQSKDVEEKITQSRMCGARQLAGCMSPRIGSPVPGTPIIRSRSGSPVPFGRSRHLTPSQEGAWKGTRVAGITAAAMYLQQETDKWEDDRNAIVRVAKEMSKQMYEMASFTRGQSSLTNKKDLIQTAKDIAANGKTIYKFATVVAKYCMDKRFAEDLKFYANHVPAMSTQLSIIASVKAATPEDTTADKVLVKNAENLMKAVMNTLKAAEAASVKGLRHPPKDEADDAELIVLAIQWKRKLMQHRQTEAMNENWDELGLRIINTTNLAPAMADVFLQR